jgi:hypothetical protein
VAANTIANTTARAVNAVDTPSWKALRYYQSSPCGEIFAAVAGMFVFFSNRLGCVGSIVASLVGTALLIMLMRSCV